jgi:dihydrolipoamide dehydrogenase
VNATGVSFDLAAVMARKQKTIETLRNGIAFTLKKHKADICAGTAQILGSDNGVFKVSVNGTVYESRKLLVCTGSEAIKPPLPGIDQPCVMTNREILSKINQMIETVDRSLYEDIFID